MRLIAQQFAKTNTGLGKAERLEAAILELIADGRLKSGDPLPPQREIADDLKIALTIVTRVFNKLKKQGVLYGERGRGSFVAFQSQFAHDFGDRFSLDDTWLNQAPENRGQAGPVLCNLVELLNFMNGQLPDSISLGDCAAGDLQEHGAKYLASLGLKIKPADVTISHNAYLAFWSAVQIVSRAGAVIGGPELSFLPIFRKRLVADNVRLIPLETDAYGILPEALESACRAYGLTAIACSPECELPTTNRMNSRRRHDIVDIARKFDLIIIENCWLMPGFDTSLAPLASLAPERTIFLEHGTKMLTCGEICSFSYVPLSLREKFIYQRNIISGPLSLLSHKITAFWFEQGLAWNDFERKNAEVARRNALAADIFAGLPARFHKSARWCWLWLDKGQSSARIREELQKQAVLVSAASHYLVGSLCRQDGLLVGLCQEPDIGRLEEALRAIRRVVED